MKLYTAKYNFNKPSTQMVTIPVDSDILVGFRFIKDCASVQIEPQYISMSDGSTTLTCTGTHANIPFLRYNTIDGKDIDKEWLVSVNKPAFTCNTQFTVERQVSVFTIPSELVGKTITPGHSWIDAYTLDGYKVGSQVIGKYADYVIRNSSRQVVANVRHGRTDSGYGFATPAIIDRTIGWTAYVDSYTFQEGDMIQLTNSSTDSNIINKQATFTFQIGEPISGTFNLFANVEESLIVEVDDADTHSVSWSDIQNKPEIPSNTSDLTNDSDFTTKTYVDGLIGNVLTEGF